MRDLLKSFGLGAVLAAALPATLAFAQEATETTPALDPVVEETVSALNSGDTAWMLTSTLLVLFMILPGLALFYGGLVRAKNMLSVLMQCTLITAVVMVIYVLYGYSFSFGGSESAFFGGFGKVFLSGVTPDSESGTIPELVFIAFQMTFACITPALIVGGFAERMRFSAVVLFMILWVTIVYFPVAHMAWDANGLYFGWGAMDFAGGTVVHINAGVAALVGALVIGPRIGYKKEIMAPHSMTLTMVGSAILWVGWFGFNAGSALSAGGGAALAMLNTFTATAGAIIGWSAIEAMTRGKASMLGAASGMVAGLVAVTPAAGFVGPVGAIFLGLIASACCYFFVQVVKEKAGYDDSLDVFGVHGIGGIVGAVLTGVFASGGLGGVGYAEGQTMSGQVMVQIQAVLVTIVWCGVVSFILYKVVDMIVGLRVAAETEREGLDLAEHGERAYVM
ncbi:ammonium transporter [Amaricoccus sp.]|uniref:ammonium transporter n=1 Tax=Amaricoccus sp. TaxID=1872485 RepID=UPI001B483DD2|nr:ammonium transporter [Amaricoccus sp.]MBP7000970.1 ammonium transporter [Amaricoccus sp.]